ncbi:MAG: dephospho-CoA kinase [Chloroflexota bacterium]
MKSFYLIGLIGNLGSGKSTVRKMLEQLGARGIDADALAHVVMQRGTPTWRAIVDAFGASILAYDGRIDRRALGTRVFADARALQTLEAIVHPAVGTLTKDLLRETTQPVVVLEAIKLIEAGMHHWCDALWAVTCPADAQIERVARTRSVSADDVRARLAAQGTLDDQLRLADVVIDNSGDLEATRAQVTRMWKALRPETAHDKSEWLWNILRVEPPPPSVVTVTPPPAPATPDDTITLPPVVSPVPDTIAPPPTPTPALPVKTLTEFDVRRTRRNDLNALAVAIAKRENRPQPLSHEEALKRFGSGGYRIAIGDGHIVAFAAWEAENLVATVREMWAESSYITLMVLPRLLALIEDEARALLCEVVVVFLEINAPLHISEQTRASGYQIVELNGLHPVWQTIVRERIKPGERIWAKRLRAEMVTKPM